MSFLAPLPVWKRDCFIWEQNKMFWELTRFSRESRKTATLLLRCTNSLRTNIIIKQIYGVHLWTPAQVVPTYYLSEMLVIFLSRSLVNLRSYTTVVWREIFYQATLRVYEVFFARWELSDATPRIYFVGSAGMPTKKVRQPDNNRFVTMLRYCYKFQFRYRWFSTELINRRVRPDSGTLNMD